MIDKRDRWTVWKLYIYKDQTQTQTQIEALENFQERRLCTSSFQINGSVCL